MSDFHDVMRLVDLPEGTAKRVEIDGEAIALVHTRGEVFAVDDTCTHAEVSLAEGEIDGCTLECWLHGSRFDLRTGQPSGPPATRAIAIHPVDVVGIGDDAIIRVAVT